MSQGADGTAAARQRRAHRKSRNGCAECKRRHIRCDERRPVCAHCAVAHRRCVFLQPPPPLERPDENVRAAAAAAAAATPAVMREEEEEQPWFEPRRWCEPPPHPSYPRHDAGRAAAEGNSWSPGADAHSRLSSSQDASWLPPLLPSFDKAFPAHSPSESGSSAAAAAEHDAGAPFTFTAQHLVLLHHAVSFKDDCIFPRGYTKQVVDIAVRHAADAPYLIDQVLALSALHLATAVQRNPQLSAASPASLSPSSLRHQATELQTRAVACFTRHARSVPADDAASAIPRFLFSSTLSLHVLAETLAEVRHLHHSRFHVFIDRFSECLRLHHGIRAVIRPTWRDLLKSELEPLLSITSASHHRSGADARGTSGTAAGKEAGKDPHGCAHLLALLEASDLGSSTVQACREAVHRLQWAFEMYSNLDDAAAGPHAASAFSVTVGSEYIDVLRRQQPEALVILAHYGILLHRSRRFWVFGDAGAFMIRAIAQNLGSYWRDALAWPLQVLQDEPE